MKYLVSIILLLLINTLYSQKLSTKSKKAQKAYLQAEKAFGYTDYNECITLLDMAIHIDSSFIEAFLFKAQIMNTKKDFQSEAELYNNIININENFYYYTLLNSATANYRIGKYNKALILLNKFVSKSNTLKKTDSTEVSILRKNLQFSINEINNPLKITPIPIKNVNKLGDVYWPSITIDNSIMYFTARMPIIKDKFQEDIYGSAFMNNKFTNPFLLSSNILTMSNEGASFISPDGQFLLFTGCGKSSSFGSCDLYLSKQKKGQWQRPINLGPKVNSRGWDSRPVISSDGMELYFTSNRKGGKGKADIWVCKRNSTTSDGYPIWDKPINLGDSINTSGQEYAPFIHPDNNTLYFSSDSHTGMGGLDIFMSHRNKNGTWGKPINIGYPINTYKDEIGIFIDAMAQNAYFASNDSTGKRQIYKFKLPDNIKPNKVTYIKVLVKNKTTLRPIDATVEIFDTQNNEKITSVKSNSNKGSIPVSLPFNHRYGLIVEKPGYLFYSKHINLINDTIAINNITVLLQPIEIGKSITLNNIFYKSNSFELSPESKTELNRVKRFLVSNKNIIIEIQGYTDNIGGTTHNKTLSNNRAQSVYNYLLNNRIEQNRLSYKGYGKNNPVTSNNTELGRAQNRRTVIKIISIKTKTLNK